MRLYNANGLARFDRRELSVWGAICTLEVLLLASYFAVTAASPGTALRYLVYPFVWINAAIFGYRRVEPDVGSRSHLAVGAGIAVAYFLTVMAVPGNIGLVDAGSAWSFRVGWYAPGWGPLVAAVTPWVRVYLVPFEVIGYLGLSYLVFANVLSITRGTLTGVFGLVTCVGCTVPVVAPVIGLLGGPASSLRTTAYAVSYDLGTAIFVLAVLALVYSHPSRRGLSDVRRPERGQEQYPEEQDREDEGDADEQ